MAIMTEGRHTGEFILSEDNGLRSRAKVLLTGSADLVAGAVLGMVATTHVTTKYTGTSGGGAITMDPTTPLLAGAQEGRYTAVCIEPGTNVGQFEVFDPLGNALGLHTVAGAAFANQIKFTIADATDFVAGDMFEIFVHAGTLTKSSGTGDGTTVLYQTAEGAKPGVYTLTCTAEAGNGGTFELVDPDGIVMGDVTVGTRFVSGGLDFVVNDGANDWHEDDVILLTVGRGKVKAWNPANTDGSGKAFGILIGAADATSADVMAAALVRDAVVTAAELTWFTGATGAQKAAGLAQLQARGIIAR